MDGASGRRTGGGSRAARRGRRPVRRGGPGGDSRRLVQLLVSLTLFLMVYVGRGVFPGQVEAWRNVLTSDVDFRAAFQTFGQEVSEGRPVRGAFEELCVTVFGGEAEPPEGTSEPVPSGPDRVELLSGTPGAGAGYGPLAERLDHSAEPSAPAESTPPAESEPPAEPSAEPAGTPAPASVTAVAEEYDAQGRKLPSNISFTHYDLGLEETAVPVMGTATSGFGYRDSPINGKDEFHLALDIGAPEGTEIGAFAAGTVRYVGESDEFGQYLMIDHANHVSTFYAHCSKLLVRKGDEVACGQTVALVGHTGNATGSHLHLTILKDDIRLDPAYYVDLS